MLVLPMRFFKYASVYLKRSGYGTGLLGISPAFGIHISPVVLDRDRAGRQDRDERMVQIRRIDIRNFP